MDEIDTHITETGAPSRRQALNAMYMFEGVHLLSEVAAEIHDSHLPAAIEEILQRPR